MMNITYEQGGIKNHLALTSDHYLYILRGGQIEFIKSGDALVGDILLSNHGKGFEMSPISYIRMI